jgi:hypothetical protein
MTTRPAASTVTVPVTVTVTVRATVPVIAAVAAWLAACVPAEPTPPGGAPAGPCDGLLAGDLVLTELLADAADGPDAGREWIEITSAASAPVSLAGVTLVHSRPDGSREKRVVLAGGDVEPGAAYVIGNAAEPLPDVLDGGYGSGLGDLFNSGGGRLVLACGATIVDEAVYGDAAPGRPLQLAGAVDYTRNDEPASWCLADGDGSPGAANPPCPAGGGGGGGGDDDGDDDDGGDDDADDGTCDDGGTRRAVVAPRLGDLAITEVMANPSGADGHAEWIELHAARDIDLHGLVLGRDPDDDGHRTTLAGAACLRVRAGAFAIIARSSRPESNGGLPAVTATASFTLLNGDGSVFVATAGGAVLDRVTWDASLDGASIQLAGALGDDPDQRCPGSEEYGPGGRGTPGAPSDCGPCLGICGQCREGTRTRAIVAPAPGDLAVVEWMANPEGLAGDRGEYIEIRARTTVDLNGIQLGRSLAAVEDPLTADTCLRLFAGQRAVFGHDGTDLPRVDGRFGFALVQSNGTIVLARDGAVIDAIAYPSSTAGRATVIDDADVVCDVPVGLRYRYNGTDHGTPRQANPLCP